MTQGIVCLAGAVLITVGLEAHLHRRVLGLRGPGRGTWDMDGLWPSSQDALEARAPQALALIGLWDVLDYKIKGQPSHFLPLLRRSQEFPGTFYHDLALYNMTTILGNSKRVEDLERALSILPTLRFERCEDASLQRAHLSWLKGTVRLALSEHRPAAEARKLRKNAYEHLST
jgi:hypothetical protein